MAHLSFKYRGYEVWLANIQPSKVARGGTKRTMQVFEAGSRRIAKEIRYDRTSPTGFGEASRKATAWIDDRLDKPC